MIPLGTPYDSIIEWVRSVGPSGEDVVLMYYKGRCDNADEGMIGYDVKVRPVNLGDGPYTCTVGGGDVRPHLDCK